MAGNALRPHVAPMESAGILIELVKGTIDAQRVREFVLGDRGVGGIVTFEGATRQDVSASYGKVVRLEYEAYEAMARRQMFQLAADAKQRRSAQRVAIVHRVGSVPAGEVSVMIAVACPHRVEAFDACRWLIDALKTEVPIWKKDVFEDGHFQWANPTWGQGASSR